MFLRHLFQILEHRFAKVKGLLLSQWQDWFGFQSWNIAIADDQQQRRCDHQACDPSCVSRCGDWDALNWIDSMQLLVRLRQLQLSHGIRMKIPFAVELQ